MLVLDGAGHPVTERTRELSPKPASPAAVLEVYGRMFGNHRPFDRVSSQASPAWCGAGW